MVSPTIESKARPVEESLIGSVLKNPKQYTTLREIVTAGDFETHSFGWVWKSFEELYQRGLSIDTVTVGDELARKDMLNEFIYAGSTGRAALVLLRSEGRPENAASYAHDVLDYSAKRKLLQEMSTGAEWALNGRRAADIQADMVKRLTDISVPGARAEAHTLTLKEALSRAYDHTAKGESPAVETGLIDLDRALDGGFYAPDLTILAARPGQGKTALAVDIAARAASRGKRVAVFSLEMANEQIAMRLIARHSGVSYGRQLRGKMKDEDWPVYTNAIESLESLPIYLNDMPALSVRQTRQILRTLEAKHGKMDLVIWDYLQLGTADEKTDTREQEVSRISRGLKMICKEFSVPMIACAQLSRAVEQRTDKRPVLSDLRESGSIEQDSDNVLFIYRPDQYEKDTSKQNVAEIIVAKHRNGPVGSVELIFRSSLTKFENAMAKNFAPNDDIYRGGED